MAASPSDEFHRRLDLARNGGGLLFCGAGFSADCLTFTPDTILGTGAQLLDIFNRELRQKPRYSSLQNAADALQEKIGHNGMMNLLKDRFTVSAVTSEMSDLLKYPWQTIYTTNYDNALEIAAQSAARQTHSLNNTDDPRTDFKHVPIIHLHGYINKWDIQNFEESCILGAESYLKLTHVNRWLDRFRRDIDQAQIVAFVGFNAADFHLNQAINDVTGLREKAFFINRPTAEADPDVTAAQKRLGTPFFIGREGFADVIKKLLAKDAPKEPSLSSFAKYAAPDPAPTVPTQAQIEDLFLYGKIDETQLARDSANGVSEYHVRRTAIDRIVADAEMNTRIILLDGFPCDGKTLLTSDLAYRLSGSRPVYKLRQVYDRLLDEVASILHYAPNAALIIENCFDLSPERLSSIASQFDGREGLLILTSRAVAVDASPVGLASLTALNSFQRISLARLDKTESRALIELTDQIAGWREFHTMDQGAKERFVEQVCETSLPNVLLRLLRSEYVKQRYREEFNKLSLSQADRFVIIVALYISYIGENAPVSFISDATETDSGAIVDSLNDKLLGRSFRLVRRAGHVIETVPSIGAENILRDLFKDSEIISAMVPVMKNLANKQRSHFGQRMFSQIMRFSILSNVVSDQDQIDLFFEHNKQEPQIRRMPLFWLQWHMAKCSTGDLTTAEKFLEQGYVEAANFEKSTKRKFDRRQLDDRRAKFLMLRASKISGATGGLFKDFKEAIALGERILRQNDPQHYPFETLAEIVRVFYATDHNMTAANRQFIRDRLDQLINYAKSRVGVLPQGFQRDKANSALQSTAR
jgi:hypothetical protein